MLPELPVRGDAEDKKHNGRLLVVAGSKGMAGGAALAVEAALRAGVGYVYVCCPGSITTELTAATPSAILRVCGDAMHERFTVEDLPVMFDAMSIVDAVVVGPAVGDGAQAWVAQFIAASKGLKIVIDADALNAIARSGGSGGGLLGELDENAVLTPHAAEAARLLGWGDNAARVHGDRHGALGSLCRRTLATVVLKGPATLVGAQGKTTYINDSGNAGLAKAGSGDVLSGIIGSLLARGMDGWDAARAGVWLHGRAADLLVGEVGQDSLIPSDLAHAFGKAFADYSARFN